MRNPASRQVHLVSGRGAWVAPGEAVFRDAPCALCANLFVFEFKFPQCANEFFYGNSLPAIITHRIEDHRIAHWTNRMPPRGRFALEQLIFLLTNSHCGHDDIITQWLCAFVTRFNLAKIRAVFTDYLRLAMMSAAIFCGTTS